MNSGLVEAIKSGDRAKVEQLVTANPKLASGVGASVSPILTAIYYGQRDIADVLAAHAPTMTMHEGAALGDLPTIRALAHWPDTLASYSNDGWTPLHLAAAFGGEEAVRVLLELGADSKQRSRNSNNNTALHACAAISHSAAIASLLLDHGAEVNAVQAGGFTALHSAAFNGSRELVEVLLRRGADPTLRTEDGQTAIDLAREKGRDEIVRLLTTAEARTAT